MVTPPTPADAVHAFGELAAGIGAVEDVDTMLHELARGACELFDIRRCSVYLRDEHSDLFRGKVLHDTHPSEGIEESDARIKRIVAGTAADRFTDEILSTRGAVQLSNAQDDPRPVRSTMKAWHIRSILGVPMIMCGEVLGLLFLDDGGSTRRFTPVEEEVAMVFASLAAITISQSIATIELRKNAQRIQRQNHVLRRASEVDERLTEAVLDGAGLHEIAASVAELTSKPCLILDGEGHRLAGSMPAWATAESLPNLGRCVLEHPQVVDAIHALGPKGSGVLEPVREAGLNHRCLLAPIGTRGDSWGSLIIMEHGARFAALDLHIARRAATAAAFQFAAERRAVEAEHDVRGSLAAELVRGPTDMTATLRRAEHLGIDLYAPHAVCLIGADTDGERLASAEVITMFQHAGFKDAVLTTSLPDGVLIVVALDPEEHPRAAIDHVREEIATVLLGAGSVEGLTAGLSTRCVAPADYRRAHGEARQVLSCARELAHDARGLVLTADDLGPGRLLLASASQEEADRFAQEALGPLLDAGSQAMVDLLATLRAFFDSSRSVRRSARTLGVHENTIRYRLTRIEELTRLTVASCSDDQLTAQLALLILRLRGWSKPVGLVPATTTTGLGKSTGARGRFPKVVRPPITVPIDG